MLGAALRCLMSIKNVGRATAVAWKGAGAIVLQRRAWKGRRRREKGTEVDKFYLQMNDSLLYPGSQYACASRKRKRKGSKAGTSWNSTSSED